MIIDITGGMWQLLPFDAEWVDSPDNIIILKNFKISTRVGTIADR